MQNKIAIGTIVAHYDDYGIVSEIIGDKEIKVLYRSHEEIEDVGDFDKWPLRVVKGQRASEEDIARGHAILEQSKLLDEIFSIEVSELKKNPDYAHLLTDSEGTYEARVLENIKRHLTKHFPKAIGQFCVNHFTPYEAVFVTWRNTERCRVEKQDVDKLLMPFLFGVTDEDGKYLHIRNPFAEVFGGVFHLEIAEPRY